MIASSTAVVSVSADDGTAVARALQAQPHHAVVDAEQLDAAAVRDQVRAHLVQRARHPLRDRHRMQPVQEQQVRDHLVLDRHVARRDDPREPFAVHVQQRGHELGRDLALRLRERLDLVEQRLDALDHPCSPNIGECTCLIVLPLPRYMCTPHGRHGSNERTARMMSMPRKFSASASSKIGMPLHASS